jgi:hypothetical protein
LAGTVQNRYMSPLRVSQAIDDNALLETLGGAWTAFTSTITAGSGTFTSVSGAGRYLVIGKTVFFTLTIGITTNGSAATYISFTLPTGTAVAYSIGAARELNSTGFLGAVTIPPGTSGLIHQYDNTYIGGTGRAIVASGTYEIA